LEVSRRRHLVFVGSSGRCWLRKDGVEAILKKTVVKIKD
jgi:hypothetical protein